MRLQKGFTLSHNLPPCNTSLSTFSKCMFLMFPQLRKKPAIEKMRRDRINDCIDQLKSLLEKEFHSHDPSAKLEKADILEMTVCFLKQQQQQQLPQRDYNEGYSHCWRESVHFLTLHSTGGRSGRELQHLHNAQRVSAAISSPDSRRPVWRPW
uniref:Transcription factor HES-5 n=1 Tax=Sinocyclocheilus anshuiensis TaxID=1608454 RepID=A0A671NJK5_9TELE